MLAVRWVSFVLLLLLCCSIQHQNKRVEIEDTDEESKPTLPSKSVLMQFLRDLKQKFLPDDEEQEEEEPKDTELEFETVNFLCNINSPKRWEVLRASPEEFTFAHTEVMCTFPFD